MKRTASTELVGKPSSFHFAVTLFEPGPPTPRRSKRFKVEPDTELEPDISTLAEVKKTTTRRTRQTVVKVEQTETVELEAKPPRPSASPKKQKPIPQSLDVPHPAPPRWREQYDAIKRMRENIVAPVDTMGCEQAQLKETDPRVCLALIHKSSSEVTYICRVVGSRP